jgi:glycosyltransferase involved in cell wall biosynthesis
MNIWFLNHHAVPGRGSGGTRHAVLAKYLHRRGHDVTIFAADVTHAGGKAVGGAANRSDGLYAHERIDGVVWRFIRVRAYRNAVQRVLSMRSYRANVVRSTDGLPKPDVIVGSCVHPYAVDAALRLARRMQVPFVYEIRDIWPASLADVGALPRWHPLYWHFRQLEVRAFRHADGVVGVCPGMGLYAAEHGVPSDRFLYLPNGIDPELHAEVTPPRSTETPVVTYLGSQGPVNGLMTLVDAAAVLQRNRGGSSPRIRLIGDGTEQPRLRQRAAELGLTNIEFLAPVPKAQVAAVCQASDAFVYCHRYMPVVAKYGVSANKIFDYLAAARPVVFSCSSWNDPVQEADAGLSVPASQADELADAIARICDLTGEERWRLGLNGRNHVLTHHNLALMAESLESFLERIAKSNAANTQRRAA